MSDLLAHQEDSLILRPLQVVPDMNRACVRGDWVDRLALEAEADRIRLYWSPKIVEEVARLRFWIWLKKALRAAPPPQRSSAWKALWSRYPERLIAGLLG